MQVGLPDIFQGGNQVQGMCGNWDGNEDNDMVARDGTQLHYKDGTGLGNSWVYPGIGGDA